MGVSAAVVNALRGWLGRVLLGAVGLGLVAYLVRGAGVDRVALVLLQAGPWLPAIVALECAQVASDVLALRFLLPRGGRDVPPATWLRSSAVAYAMMVLLPAGRASGEVARATLIARHVGASRAALASTQLQAAYLLANAVASVSACVAVASRLGLRTPLAVLLAANAAIMALSAAALLAVLWDARVGRWLEKLRRRLHRAAREPRMFDDPARWHLDARAVAACIAGRAAQLVQYGVILVAIGGAATVHGALAAHGIHLVGATLGDALPNQLGIVDGAYRAFAGVLGLGHAPERALSIAFVAHAEQLTLAGVAVLAASVVGHANRVAEAHASR
jgi:hypothetical protein